MFVSLNISNKTIIMKEFALPLRIDKSCNRIYDSENNFIFKIESYIEKEILGFIDHVNNGALFPEMKNFFADDGFVCYYDEGNFIEVFLIIPMGEKRDEIINFINS